MKQISRFFGLLCVCWVGFGNAAPPNIVMMLADDLGYADIACYGAPDVKTPRIDQLAAEGVRFTQMYGNGAECTPSRTALLTGRYPQRVGGMECAIGTGNVGRYDDAIALANRRELGLPAEYATLAPVLKKAGYKTAVFGKWHLGYEQKFNPRFQGFDEFRGFLGGNVDYFKHIELSDLVVHLDGVKPIKREGYMTHLITDDCVDFINRQNPDKPFFLYVPFSTPHFPFQGPNDGPDMHPEDQWTAGTRQKYVELLEDMDQSVGKIIDSLKQSQLDQNTIVVFASDHGAMKPGLNSPFRDYKGTLFEGGIRVPCAVRWPGKIEPGIVSTQTGTLMDLTASFLKASGAELPGDLDGIDILGHVTEGKKDQSRTLCWTAKRGERVWQAIRVGDYKYVSKTDVDGVDEKWFFNLKEDPEEKKSLFKHKSGEIANSSDLPIDLDVIKQKLNEFLLQTKATR